MRKGRPEKDILGFRYNKLIAIKRISARRYIFQCDCGNVKEITKYKVVFGEIKSCGCLSKKHGLSLHPLYGKWRDIKQRCSNTKCKAYRNYGAKGILICDEWKNNFLSFYNWAITNGWENGLTIDRIYNNKGYCPDNCHFVTLSENTSKTCRRKLNEIAVKVIKYYLAKGVYYRELAKIYKVDHATIWQIKNNKTWERVII